MRPRAAPPSRPRRERPRRGVPVVALFVCTSIVIVAAMIAEAVADREASPIRRESWPAPRWGLTHTEVSADLGEPPATASAEEVLARQPLTQNQHIMGWGVGNPEPAPDVYDFGDLDGRIELVRRTGGVPVITLCCAPDWMKGGEPGRTDWSRLEEAPRPEHYQDFAELAGEVAARYPDVRHFIVWNELKGFFDHTTNRWDHEGYTRLYNLVYEELKRVDPDNRVGGPYSVMASEPPGWDGAPSQLSGPWGVVDQRSLDNVEYWLEHSRGADFIVFDAATTVRDGQLTTDPFTAIGKFEAVTTWVRERTDLPIWVAEWYVEPPGSRWPERYRVAVQATAMMSLAKSGVTTALYWNPQTTNPRCPGCLWTATTSSRGGRATLMGEVLSGFARDFPAGTELTDLPASSGDVRVLARPERAVVASTVDRRVRVTVGDESLSLQPYEVRFVSHGDS